MRSNDLVDPVRFTTLVMLEAIDIIAKSSNGYAVNEMHR
jgi:hypothetical protein